MNYFYFPPLVIVAMLNTMAGIGGGALLFPIYYLLADYTIQESVLLSVMGVVGTAFIRTIYYVGLRDLIKYRILRSIIPFDAAMAAYGFILNLILPNWLTLIFICLILTTVLFKTCHKTRQIRLQELKIINVNTARAPVTNIQQNSCMNREWRSFRANIKYLLPYLILIVGQNLLSKYFDDFCSYKYWLFVVGFSIANLAVGYYFLPNINNLEIKLRNKLIFFGANTGWISSLLGIGGGMLINPLLLYYNFSPEEIVATGSMIALFSGLSSALQYIFSDDVKVTTIDLFLSFLVGIVGAVLGMIVVTKCFKRKSLILIILLLLILSSFILIVTFTTIDIADNGFDGFQNLCNTTEHSVE